MSEPYNPTAFMTLKIDDDNRLAIQQLRFIKDDYAFYKNGVLNEDYINELKEKDNKQFDNMSKDKVRDIFMGEIRKMIDIIKLENVVESHKAVTKYLKEEPNLPKVDKRLVINYEKAN